MTSNCKPALFVVGEGVSERGDLPPADDISGAVVDHLEEVWGEPCHLVDVLTGMVDIQDEVPPADPVKMYAVVLVFDQMPTIDYDPTVGNPLQEAIDVIYETFGPSYEDGGDVEVWIDAVEGPSA